MAKYIRKSFKLGPIRFNLSKSGIGVSAGVKGLRVGRRPNGSTYIHGGRHGLYFREELNGKNQTNQFSSPNSVPKITTQRTQAVNDDFALPPMPGSPELQQLLHKINAGLGDMSHLTLLLFMPLLSLSMLLILPLGTALAITLMIFALSVAAFIHFKFYRNIINFNFDYNPKEEQHFQQLHDTIAMLQNSNRCWFVSTYPRPRHQVTTNPLLPKLVKCNLNIPGFDAGYIKIYFFPDFILYLKNDHAYCIDYSQLTLNTCTTTHTLNHPLPNDAVVIRKSWIHTRKDGQPDQRYRDNPTYFTCSVGQIDFSLPEGTIFRFQTSNPEVVKHIKGGFDLFLNKKLPDIPREPSESILVDDAPEGLLTKAEEIHQDLLAMVTKSRAENNSFVRVLEKAETLMAAAIDSKDHDRIIEDAKQAVELIKLYFEINQEINR